MRHLEDSLQKSIIKYWDLKYPKWKKRLVHAPNGGKRDARTGAQMKYEGVLRGVADLILLVPKKGFASLCIEMKTPMGKQREEQIEWQREAEKYRNKYVICRSLQDFMNEVNSYLR